MEMIHALFSPRGDGPYPTLLALHGRGANALDLLGLAPYICGGRFLVLCPQGPVPVPLGPPGAMGYAWFPATGGGPPDVAAIEAAQAHLKQFLAAALTRYPIDPHRLALLGFSQGGVMTYRFGLAEPEQFTALVALSTWLPPTMLDRISIPPARPAPPLLIQHGSRDEVIEVERARQSVEALRPLGLSVTYREYAIGHEISAESLNDLSTWLQERVLSSVTAAS